MRDKIAEALRTLPWPIKIGAYDWNVVIEEGDTKCGEADFEFQAIRLWPAALTSPNHVVGVLIHECLHVIYDNEKLVKAKRDKEAREEQIVMGFEVGLVQLFRDNPKLMTWIKKGLK